MSYQLAKFIDPSLSVFKKLTWVRDRPDNWSTKYSVGVEENITTGPTEGLGFATNVLGDGDGIPMVAYLNQIELQSLFTERVRKLPFAEWKLLSDQEVMELAVAPAKEPTR